MSAEKQGAGGGGRGVGGGRSRAGDPHCEAKAISDSVISESAICDQ